jgi:hypothetical protein
MRQPQVGDRDVVSIILNCRRNVHELQLGTITSPTVPNALFAQLYTHGFHFNASQLQIELLTG